ILVASNREVISLNRRAREITERRDALLIQNNLLSGLLSTQTSKLEQLIARAISGVSSAREPNTMTLVRESSDWPLSVLVVPFESRGAAVLISDPELKCLPNQQVLSSLFRLTPT